VIKKREVIHVPHVPPRPERVSDVAVHGIENDIGEPLTRQTTDGNALAVPATVIDDLAEEFEKTLGTGP
jgi:hypothetical protein